MSAEQNKLGVMPVGKLMFSMAIPAIISMMIHSLYNIVDSIFVAQLGQPALTAVNLVYPVQMLQVAAAVGTAIGVNSLIARRLGEGNQAAADSAATHGIVLSILTWTLFALFGIFGSAPYLKAYSDDPVVVKYGIQYCSIILIGTLPNFVGVTIEKIFQATGNMIYPMIISTTAGVANLILDPLFIFGLFGFPRLEVAGAAIATVLGQCLGCSVALFLLFTKDHKVSVKLKGFRFNKISIRDIYRVGFPTMLMQSIGSVLNTFLNGILIGFSGIAVNVLGIYFKLQTFVFMPVFGLNQGVMPILGYNYGARNKERLLKAYKLSLLAAFAIMGTGLLIFQLIPGVLLLPFNPTEELNAIGIPAMRAISLCFLPAAFGIMSSNLFQATGHGTMSLAMSMLRQLVGVLPFAYITARLVGLHAVWFAFPVAECLAVPFCIIMLRRLWVREVRDMSPRA